MKIYDAIIIGSGAAAYASADRLFEKGIKNIAILTENRLSGTSRNTGSDKQTYYKLSLDGVTSDSPYKMAKDICRMGCCDGEKAYLQAVNSAECFLHLVMHGVNFPRDEYGGFPGYKTDHDNTKRATSIGPLTSKVMTEKLENAVLNENKTELFDLRQVVKIVTDEKSVCGVIALKENNEFEVFASKNVVCATGAPACIYENSVYPASQHGMTGVLIEAGVSLCNFSQWQYGLASTDFRWNVSGSFMQVVPRFISVATDGTEEEFLLGYFSNPLEMCNNIFLKGYQWPFSFERIDASSKIDIAVHEQTKQGKKVYLDFTRNPTGFSFGRLSDEAKNYLAEAGVTGKTPIERLLVLNKKAIDVYARQGIDLFEQRLRIAVCAQHNNGGVFTDNHCMSEIEGLYVIGEAAGNFGIARPGGTALNDTQVGALLCACHIAEKEQRVGFSEAVFSESLNGLKKIKDCFKASETVDYSHIAKKMSAYAAHLRDKENCVALLSEVTQILNDYPSKHKTLSRYFYDRDMLLSAKALLNVIIDEMSLTGSRGGAVFFEKSDIKAENLYYRDFLTISKNGNVSFKKVSDIPNPNKAFEKYLLSCETE